VNPPADLLTSSPDAARVPREILEARLAGRLTARLNNAVDALPHDVTERLRFSRERALAMAVQKRRATAMIEVPTIAGRAGRAGVLAGPPGWSLRLASVVPLVVLVFGLALIERQLQVEQIRVAADIDSALLADDLPPDAYTDPGFQEYLRLHGGF
jgi:hypothetical protein